MSGVINKSGQRLISVMALVVCGALLSWVIMFKANLLVSDLRFGYRGLNLVPFKGLIDDGTYYLECILNVLVYIPFGFFFCDTFRGKRFLTLAIILVLTSVGFEVLQYILAFGSTDVTDVICNGLGGILGGLIFLWMSAKGMRGWIFTCACCAIAVGLPIVFFAITSTVQVFDVYLSML